MLQLGIQNYLCLSKTYEYLEKITLAEQAFTCSILDALYAVIQQQLLITLMKLSQCIHFSNLSISTKLRKSSSPG